MDKALMRQWIEALRSGTYQQGAGCLRRKSPNGERFCCLGVLHDIAGSGWVEDGAAYVTRDDGLKVQLELSLLSRIGLPSIDRRDGEGALIEMNDAGKSFNDIADLLEDLLKQSESEVSQF